MATILYVDDEPAAGLILTNTLERAGHRAIGAHNVPEALQVLTAGGIGLIICDYQMPGISGLEFLAMLRSEKITVPLIMLIGHASIDHAVAAIKAGAIDHVAKPINVEQLQLAVERVLELVRLRDENETLRREVMEFRNEQQIPGGRALAPKPNGNRALESGHALHLPTLNVAEAERALIQRALVAANQNRTRAAELLGISVRTLRNKLNVRGLITAEMAIDGGDGGQQS